MHSVHAQPHTPKPSLRSTVTNLHNSRPYEHNGSEWKLTQRGDGWLRESEMETGRKKVTNGPYHRAERWGAWDGMDKRDMLHVSLFLCVHLCRLQLHHCVFSQFGCRCKKHPEQFETERLFDWKPKQAHSYWWMFSNEWGSLACVLVCVGSMGRVDPTTRQRKKAGPARQENKHVCVCVRVCEELERSSCNKLWCELFSSCSAPHSASPPSLLLSLPVCHMPTLPLLF